MSSEQPSEKPPVVESDQPATEPKPGPAKKRGVRYWIAPTILVLLAVLVIVVRTTASETDFQIANLLTYLCGFVGAITLAIWYLRAGPGRFVSRLAATFLVACLPVIFLSLFRVERVTGELVPVFRPRWLPPRDAQLEKLVADAGGTVVLDETELDFAGFLGSDRSNRLNEVKIDEDWEASEPKLIWRQPIGAGWSGFSAVNGYAFTLEQRGDEEIVSCYRISDGKLQWSHSIDGRHETVLGGVGPRSTPVIDDGRVYAMGATGVLRCLDGKDGSLIWDFKLPQDDMAVAWGRAASPLIEGDLVIVPYGGRLADEEMASLIALDKLSGEEVWRAGDEQVSYASPAVGELDGVRQIVAVNESSATGHALEDGKVLWRTEWPGKSNANATASQPVFLPGNHLLLSKGYGGGAKLLKVEQSDGEWNLEEVWADARVLKTKFTNVAVFDDTVIGLSDGILEAVDWKTGERLWKKGRYGHGQILGLADTVIVQAEKGFVALCAANQDGFKELGRFDAIDGQTWNNLCLFGDMLLVRNSEEAACYQLPGP